MKKTSKVGKVIKSINFDVEVLDRLEKRCKMEGTKVSSFVNHLVRITIFKDDEFYRERAKFHYQEFKRYKYMSDTNGDVK